MNRQKKFIWQLLFILTLSIFLAACNSDEGTSSNNNDSNNNDSKSGGDLIIAELSDAQSLDPHGANDVPSSNVTINIYETLVTRDSDANLAPSLAESWEQIDELTWEFKLKKGVIFHDSEPFTAEAVKKTFDRILDKKVASSRAFLYAMVTEVKVIDDYTVQFITEYPFSPLLAHLTHTGGAIISPKAIDEDYAAMAADSTLAAGSVLGTNPVGTGPFKFVSWTPGTEIKLERFDKYSGGGEPAKVDSVTFKVIPESAVRIAELESGYTHIAGTIEPGQVSKVNDTEGISVIETAASSVTYVGFNMQKEPFNNKLVRQAISKAIDRKQLIDGIYEGYGIEAISLIAPGIFGYTDDLPSMEYNIEEAKALLKEAGYADGFSTTIWTNDNPARQNIAIVLQEELKKLNINAKIEVLEWGAYLEKTAAGEHDMFILGWSNATLDADNGIYALVHSSQHGTAGNRSFYTNEQLDDLLLKGRQEADETARAAIYKEALQIIADDAPVANVLHQYLLTGVSDKISGMEVGTDSLYRLRNVKIND